MAKRRRKSPGEKKRRSLRRDRVDDVRSAKASRRSWARTKARTERAYRHSVRATLKQLDVGDAEEGVLSRHRKVVEQWPDTAGRRSATLAERRARRAKRTRRKAGRTRQEAP